MTDQSSPTTKASFQSARPHRRRRWLAVSVLSLAIVISVWRLLFFNLWDSEEFKPPVWDGKARFVETCYPKSVLPENAGMTARISAAYHDFKERRRTPNPAAMSMTASPIRLHSISQLNQCMELSATRYLVAYEAWVGTVQFGHSNLNGAQWVTAFELALQTNRPECYHPASNRWTENLLFIREKAGVVKVIPPSRLADYQKAGLVSSGYKLETVSTNTPTF